MLAIKAILTNIKKAHEDALTKQIQSFFSQYKYQFVRM